METLPFAEVKTRLSGHETLEILADTDTVAAIRQARGEIARGEVHPTDEVLAAFHRRDHHTG